MKARAEITAAALQASRAAGRNRVTHVRDLAAAAASAATANAGS